MKKEKKGFFKEFKEFITRGNIVDMAIGVIIGGAFSAIVTALTNKILKPFIDWIVMEATGGSEVGLYTFMKKVTVDGEVDFANSIYIDWGAFIMAIIDFLLIAIVLFIIIKVLMSIKAATAGLKDADRKALKKQAKERASAKGISKTAAMEEIVAEKIAEQEAAAAAEEAAKAAEEAAKVTPEKLLAEIRDILAAQAANGEKAEEAEEEKEDAGKTAEDVKESDVAEEE